MSDTVKIVYNACHGGFGLSEAAVRRYAELKGLSLYPERDPRFAILPPTYWLAPEGERSGILHDDAWNSATQEQRVDSNKRYSELVLSERDIERTDPLLVQVVEELGEAASGPYAKLKIAEVAAGSRYRIDEYDGFESVETPDSYEWKTA
jgi:hypothetical protein